jgi:hypothetical protein
LGAELSGKVAEGFTKTIRRPLTKESVNKLKENMLVPSNCKGFSVPKMNLEIWRTLPSHARLTDVKHQQNQQVLSYGLITLARIADGLATRKSELPKDLTSTLMKQAIEGANLIGDQFQSINTSRRMEVKRYINPEYANICSAQVF